MPIYVAVPVPAPQALPERCSEECYALSVFFVTLQMMCAVEEYTAYPLATQVALTISREHSILSLQLSEVSADPDFTRETKATRCLERDTSSTFTLSSDDA